MHLLRGKAVTAVLASRQRRTRCLRQLELKLDHSQQLIERPVGSAAAPSSGSASDDLGQRRSPRLLRDGTLKPLAAAGKGKVAVILPDTVSSARYVEFDAPT